MGLKEREGDDEMGLWRGNAGGIRRGDVLFAQYIQYRSLSLFYTPIRSLEESLLQSLCKLEVSIPCYDSQDIVNLSH